MMGYFRLFASSVDGIDFIKGEVVIVGAALRIVYCKVCSTVTDFVSSCAVKFGISVNDRIVY